MTKDHPLDDEDEIEHMETESDHIQPDNTPSVVVTPQTQPTAIFINSPGGFLARTAQANQASSSVPINIQHATMQSLPGYGTGSPLLHTGFQNLIIQPQNSPPVLLVNQARQVSHSVFNSWIDIPDGQDNNYPLRPMEVRVFKQVIHINLVSVLAIYIHNI